MGSSGKASAGSGNLKAPISEVFSSYQGEGIFVGQPQVFIRFCGCNLRCGYCDTPENQHLHEHQKYFSLSHILELARESMAKRSPSSLPLAISLTGGEPLLYPGFLSALLPQIKKMKLATYLETNGTLPEAYAKVAKWVDVVAMDIKPPSASGTDLWKDQAKFLKLAGKKAFVKMVVTSSTKTEEVVKAVNLVKAVSPVIPFVLQPVSVGRGAASAQPWQLYEWLTLARKKLQQVHVIPQMHKLLWKVR